MSLSKRARIEKESTLKTLPDIVLRKILTKLNQKDDLLKDDKRDVNSGRYRRELPLLVDYLKNELSN